jgi:long-chain acyl-CoA synthetase
MSGGSKLDSSIAKDFRTLGFVMFEGYGMTETAPSMSVQSASKNRIGTVGWVYPGGEAVIKNGEFCYRGPNVMKGYYNRPEETAALFDEEGFLHTGDRAEIDSDGYIRITGRIKEIIVLPNGKNINPDEIENELLQTFPIIKDVGVIEKNASLFAVVFPDFQKIKDNQIINIRETIKWDVIDRYNVSASHHKKIMDFAVVETELPRTRIGKLRRFALSSMIGGASESKQTGQEPDFEEYHQLKETMEAMLGRPVSAFDHAELDLNMDSLDRVELQARVEANFGFSLSNEDISSYPRIADLAGYIRQKKTRSETEKTDWGSILRQKIEFKIPRRHYMMRALLFLLRPILRLYFRIKPIGLNRVPLGKPVIFAPNHQSFLDGIALLALLKRRTRKKTYFFAKDRNFNSRFRQFFARKANIILININKNLKETLQQMAAIVADGNNVVIFPEGARSRDGSMIAFKKMFAIISKELSIPVVPVAIQGMYEAFSIRKKIPRPVKITIEFLDPVMPEDLEYDEIVEKTRCAIADKINRKD